MGGTAGVRYRPQPLRCWAGQGFTRRGGTGLLTPGAPVSLLPAASPGWGGPPTGLRWQPAGSPRLSRGCPLRRLPVTWIARFATGDVALVPKSYPPIRLTSTLRCYRTRITRAAVHLSHLRVSPPRTETTSQTSPEQRIHGDPSDPAVREALARHVERRALGELADAPPLLRRLLAAAIGCVPDRPSVDRVSSALGMSYRSMRREVLRAGCGSPAALLGWARLFYTTVLLEDHSPSVERAAAVAGFESGAALRHLYRRHAGARPLVIHERGGVRYLASLFRRQYLAPSPRRSFAHGIVHESARVGAQKVQL
jgi:AraC-like DNA-binding protein